MAILCAHVGFFLISRESIELCKLLTQHSTGRAELATTNYIGTYLKARTIVNTI